MYNYTDILIFIILISIILIFAHIYYNYNCNNKEQKNESIDEKYTRVLKEIIKRYF
jgi:hypothetical protein